MVSPFPSVVKVALFFEEKCGPPSYLGGGKLPSPQAHAAPTADEYGATQEYCAPDVQQLFVTGNPPLASPGAPKRGTCEPNHDPKLLRGRSQQRNSQQRASSGEGSARRQANGNLSVCLLHIKPLFLLVDLQHTQCPR